MAQRSFLFTSESVTEGHPDKLCDQISDGVLDEVLRQDKKGRVACEAFVTVGLVIVGGEITTRAYVDIDGLVREIIRDVGYDDSRLGFDYESCAVLNAIHSQSPDIAQGVNTGGAGDQGLMSGYACRETKELMPLPIMLAHYLCRQLAAVRRKKTLPYLGPDGKSQVTIEYRDGRPHRVEAVVVSTQHSEEVLDRSRKRMKKKAIEEIIDKVIIPVISGKMIDNRTKFYVNPTGKFVVGGPRSDTGMTGRKIIVDTYGGMARHGGGAFSGKDPSKVDRSAAYAGRYVAKNIVAAGLAEKCELQISYAIGVADPTSISIQTFGTGKIADEKIVQLIGEHFNLKARGIVDMLDLLRPIYKKTAAYGHFGREEPEFTWEKTDKA
ncbi:MAG: methionine adenosyltransferase, partial [candidate division Zixibacteria bacterium]|nr:methionine adenosyltransferase [candidate division Zixibacteria bacterium]